MEKKLIEEITGKTEPEGKPENTNQNSTQIARSAKKLASLKLDRKQIRRNSFKTDSSNKKTTSSKDLPLKRRNSFQINNTPSLKKKFKCIKTYPNAHQDFIEKLILFKNGKIASLSYDFTIKMWDIGEMSKKPIYTLKGHTNRVTDMIQYTNTLLVSVSQDKTIRKWNINTGKDVYCYEMKHPFLCICPVTDVTVCCGGGDKALRFYDLSADKQIDESYILEGHTDLVTCVLQIDSYTMASGSGDHSIRFWDINKRKHLFTLEGHYSGVSCLKLLKDKRFASGSYDNTIIIWNIEKRDVELRLSHGTGHILCMSQFIDGRIVSGGSDWTITVWNSKNGSIETSFEAHDEAVCGLVVTVDGKIVSGSRDMAIKVWE